MKIIEEIIIPQESVNDQNVIVVELFFKNGDAVKNGDVILEIETSKSIVTVETQKDGFIEYYCKVGDKVDVGAVVSKIFDVYEKNENNIVVETKEVLATTNNDISFETIFSNKAQALIEKNNISKDKFLGLDFVNEHCVNSFLNPNLKTETIVAPVQKVVEKVSTENKENVHIEKLPTQKIREIEYLSAVQQFGLNSAITVNVNFENIIPFLNTHLSILKGAFLPVITYELARLLRKYPKLNSYYENESIVYYDDINIGIAIDMDKGLKVLKIAETDKLSMVTLEESILSISKKYIENKITPYDASNITFTISDLSGQGVASFLPLVNKANAAILGISSLDRLNGINLTITFDHRITEGKYVAEFLKELKNRLESYSIEPEKPSNNIEPQKSKCYKCHRKLGDKNYTFLKVLDSDANDQILCHVCYDKWS